MQKYQTNLAGLSFRPAEVKDLVALLEVGDEIFLEREGTNQFDGNAIRLYLDTPGSGRVFIGYVEKLVNSPIAARLDEGATATAKVVKTYPHDGSPARTGMWAKPLIEIEVSDAGDALVS